MNILLVVAAPNPKSILVDSVFFIEPLGFEYVGAGVQENHDVKLLDLRVESETDIRKTLESFQPDIIGCGGSTIDVYSIKQICSLAKEILPGILTVVGGHHATVMPRDFFDKDIDIVVLGEGSLIFKKICQCLESQKSFEEIENIYFRNDNSGADRANGKMLFTRKEPYPGLDTLPFPARTLTAHMRDRYIFPLKSKLTPFASILSSTGCFYRCKFCSTPRFMNYKVYTNSIDRVLEELTSIKEPFIFWADDEFLLDPERAVLLAKEIEKAGIKKDHLYMGRSNNIINHPECIEEWAKIGLEYVFIGIESHKENELKNMKKGTSMSKNEEAVRICHANNVMVRGAFMVRPDYDEEDFRRLAKYVRELDVDYPTFTIYTPLPGTELFEEEKKDLITGDYRLFDLYHAVLPTKLPLKQYYKQLIRLQVETIPLRMFKQMDPKLRQMVFAKNQQFLQKLEDADQDHLKL